MKGTVLRVVSGGAVAAVLMTLVALPASAAVAPQVKPTVEVSTPSSEGEYYRRGSIWVTGIACDPNASPTDGTAGISKVSVFMGDRDDPTVHSGRGDYVGAATIGGSLGTGSGSDLSAVFNVSSRLGLGNPDVSICKNKDAGWRVLTSPFKKGAYTLHIYVLAKNGMETLVTRGIRVDLP